MAPKQSATVSNTPKKVAKVNARVTKRPARGFHKFRSGVLNVAPKGREREL